MSDYIDRQAAREALQKEIDKAIPPFTDTIGAIRCGVRLSRNIIEDLPSAQPLTDADYMELRDRFGREVEFVVEDMISGKGERWNV